MIYPFSSPQLVSLDAGGVLKVKVGSKGLVKTLRLYNFTPAFWQLTNDYDIIIDTLPPWREKIVRVSDSQNYYLTSDMTAPYFSSAAVANTQYQFGYEQTNKKWMPEEIPLLSLVQVTGSLPAGTNYIGKVVGEDGDGNSWGFWFNTHTGLTGQGPWVGAAQFVYNGTNLDTIRANTQGTLLASAARTATATSPTLTNYNAKGVVVSVNVTAVAGTSPTLTVTINAISPVSGTKIPILTASTAISAIGEYAYQVYPGAAGYTQSAAAALPRTWEVDYVIGGTSPSFTFSSGYALIN